MFVVAAVVLLLIASLRRIPEGHVYTFRRVGGHVRLVGSGTHWVVPLVERVERKISLAGTSVAVELERDGHYQTVVVYYQVLDAARAGSLLADLEERLRAATRRQFAAPELPAEAEARRQWLKQALNADARRYGLLVARVDLDPLA
jgi:regulator of protease activity HflC (stomatin/prohibitin superfamily)